MKKLLLIIPALFLCLALLIPQVVRGQGAEKGKEGGFCRDAEPRCDSGLTCKLLSVPADGYFCLSQKTIESLPINTPPPPKIYCDSANKQTDKDTEGKIFTAIGCIPVNDTNQFIAFVLRWAIGIGGGIAFVLIIVASFMIMTSTGNPERIQAGKELLVSAIAGLIMLILAVFILKVVGIDILGLGGLGIQ